MNNDKYKDIIVPTYVEEEEEYVVNTSNGVQIGDLYYIVGEFCKDGVLYHYNNKYYTDYPNHEHSLDGVIEAVIDEPETFSIEKYLDEYSVQERALLYNLKDLILLVKKEGKYLSNEELYARAKEYRQKESDREK